MSAAASGSGGSGGGGGVRGARRFRFVVAGEERDDRLDQLLARHVPELSRGAARTLLALGGVFVDRHRVKIASRRLRAGQTVEAWVGGALERARAPEAVPAPRPRVVFHDEHVAVVEKPAGLLTAPTPEGDRGSLVDLVERELLPGARAFVVHRLDRMTSGLLVVARSALANRALSERFRTHDVEREYLAVVRGALDAAGLPIDAPIGGRRALTRVSTDERLGAAATLVRARLETGRTHQIRIHLAGIGHPVLGDREHGDAGERSRLAASHGGPLRGGPSHGAASHSGPLLSGPPHGATARGAAAIASGGADPVVGAPPRLALHAAVLGFVHPASGEALRFESPWPADLAPWLEALRAAARSATSDGVAAPDVAGSR